MPLDIKVEQSTPDGEPQEETVEYWLAEIKAAQKREKEFRKDGQRVIDIYESEKAGTEDDQTNFNILFSNTETLLPALFSAVPRPVVLRRFKDDDPLGKAASDAGRRVLEFEVDTNMEGYETYEEAMQAATLDGLLPGRGWTCVKFDAAMNEVPDSDEEGAEVTPYLQSEMVCLETVSWNRVLHGYAKKWSKVPWVAYEQHIDQKEATRLFGKEIADALTYSDEEEKGEHDERPQGQTTGQSDQDDRDKGQKKTALIYQIWDKKGGKKIRYLAPQYKDGLAKIEDDPLQLTGFFNCPKPLRMYLKSNNLKPTAPYRAYEEQARELNRLSRRLRKVVEAIKVRGVYTGDVSTELGKLLKEDDNALVPAESTSSLAFEKGLQNAIWMLPIQDLIVVAEKLFAARQACKQVIYEITGISDIIRGSSVASETATAQNLKSQWGTLRLKRCQREVQRYARDLLRMMLEISATKFSEETWAKMTGLPFTTKAQAEQAQAIVDAAPLGQPPDPQAMALLQRPMWGDVLKLLQDDVQRAYRVDIETNSTLEPEAAEDHKDITEMLTAMGQTLNGLAPLIESGSMPFQAAQALLLAICRRFRFGNEIEDYVKAMQPPKPKDDGKAAAAQAEQAKAQVEQQKMQQEAQKHQAEMQQQAAVETAKHQRETQDAQAKAGLEQQSIAAEVEKERIKADAMLRAKQFELAAERSLEQMKASVQQDTELKKAALQGAVQIETAKITAQQKAESDAQSAVVEGERVKQEGEQATAKQDSTEKLMAKIMETQTQLLKAITAPRKAVRGKDGKIERVEAVA